MFAIAGFGLNLNQTMFSVDAKTNSIGTIGSYSYDAISGGIGLGGYLYSAQYSGRFLQFGIGGESDGVTHHCNKCRGFS